MSVCGTVTVVKQDQMVTVSPTARTVDVAPVELRLITTEPALHQVAVTEPAPHTVTIDTIPASTLPMPRVGVELLGAIDGANVVFTTPDAFVPVGGYGPAFFYNGQRLAAADYTVSEGGGAGTGYDTVTVGFTPCTGDALTADYYLA